MCEEGKTKKLASAEEMGVSFGHNKAFMALENVFVNSRVVLAYKLGSYSQPLEHP